LLATIGLPFLINEKSKVEFSEFTRLNRVELEIVSSVLGQHRVNSVMLFHSNVAA
jgi:hypothetical protein